MDSDTRHIPSCLNVPCGTLFSRIRQEGTIKLRRRADTSLTRSSGYTINGDLQANVSCAELQMCSSSGASKDNSKLFAHLGQSHHDLQSMIACDEVRCLGVDGVNRVKVVQQNSGVRQAERGANL